MRIFNETTLRKLEHLALVASGVRAGSVKGERRSTKRGTSIEFADYRNYSQGDDLRRLDWNAYARLDRPFVKLFHEEEDLSVHVLIDASQSMRWGESDQDKFVFAQRLAGALGTIALTSGDRLQAAFLGGSRRSGSTGYGPARGRGHLMDWLEYLDSHQPSGTADLDASLGAYALRSRRPGLAVLISDLFWPTAGLDGLGRMQAQGYDVVVLHLLAPEELDPPFAGDLQLVDVETGQAQDVSLDGGLRDLYRRRLSAWQADLKAYCVRRGMRYAAVSSGVPWEVWVLHRMRELGVLR